MKLVEIHIDGFGKLVNRNIDFSPGFNLVFGLNEAGKSTLQRAILAMLYGFFSEGRRTKEDQRDLWASMKPWDKSASYQGSLVYELDNGQSFQATRVFAPQFSTFLVTYPDQSDISMRFRRADEGRVFFAEEQLGMTKAVFENVCTVRQAELVALETSATAVSETLMRLSASASSDVKAVDAMLLLEKTLEVEVGIVNSPTRPLAKARRHLTKLEREHSQVLHTQRELFSKIIMLDQLEQQLQQLDLKRQQLRYLHALSESQGIREQLSAIDEVATEVSRWARELAKWEAWTDFPIHLRG